VHITLITYGTRGDVQPFVALGVGLTAAGHSIRLAAPETYASFAAQHELDFVPLPGDPAYLSQQLVETGGRNPIHQWRAMMEFALPLGANVLRSARAASRDADLILHSFLLCVGGHTIARELGVPDIYAEFFPVFTATAAFPSLLFPDLGSLGAYNRITHALFNYIFWSTNRIGYGMVQKQFSDLPVRVYHPFVNRRNPTPILNAFSPLVVPPAPDWGAHVHTTGYWFLDTAHNWQPPDALTRFLESGPPPVCIGFGSMIAKEAKIMNRIVLDALAQSRQRGVLLGGWGKFSDPSTGSRQALPESVFVIDSAPHDWLFPRMAAVVHHGGAGTTAAGLRAGVPSIITPFTADQPFWGRRAAELGVGPTPIHRRRLTARNLAGAITRAVNDPEMRARAAVLGKKIRDENGVTHAVNVIEQHLHSH